MFLVNTTFILLASNDAYDAETGVDKEKKESVVNMTGRYQNSRYILYIHMHFLSTYDMINMIDMINLCSREGVLISAYACLVFGLLGLLWGAWQAQNMQIFVLLAGAICCGYIYQVFMMYTMH